MTSANRRQAGSLLSSSGNWGNETHGLAWYDQLIEEARAAGGHKTEKEAVTVLESADQIADGAEYDYKVARRRELR
jgi:hypothetical protein